MSDELKLENETYEKHKLELLGSANGKYVLIKDDKILGAYESQTDAIADGYRQFGVVPFLVRQVKEFDSPTHYYARVKF